MPRANYLLLRWTAYVNYCLQAGNGGAGIKIPISAQVTRRVILASNREMFEFYYVRAITLVAGGRERKSNRVKFRKEEENWQEQALSSLFQKLLHDFKATLVNPRRNMF